MTFREKVMRFLTWHGVAEIVFIIAMLGLLRLSDFDEQDMTMCAGRTEAGPDLPVVFPIRGLARAT